MSKPALIVHGGAGNIAEEDHAGYRAGCTRAAEAGWKVLEAGGSALDAVEAAVRILEDDPTYDSGYGSDLNQRGEVEVDAILMDGRTLDMGAVMAVHNMQNPITLARFVMTDTPHNILVGTGAEDFARSKGLPFTPNDALISPRVRAEYAEWKAKQTPPAPSNGTCGAVALDQYGNVAAGTSTGGTRFKMPGRVGDSPLIGSGAYADNLTGAASSTGVGEDIMRVCLAKTATDAIGLGMNAQAAADHAVKILVDRIKGIGALILVDKDGTIGFAHSTQYISAGWVEVAPDGRVSVKTAIQRRA